MSEPTKPFETTTEQLERELEAPLYLTEALQQGIRLATEDYASHYGRPVHPDVLAGLLMREAATIALHFGMSNNKRPFEIEEYVESLARRMRRGFHQQLVHAFAEQAKQKGVTQS